MRIDANPDHGIIDIFLAAGDQDFGKPLPFHILENGASATVIWTLTQFPGMPDHMFKDGCASMERELVSLKDKFRGVRYEPAGPSSRHGRAGHGRRIWTRFGTGRQLHLPL